MAHFALLWKARTIERYRLEYEREKINSLFIANARTPKKSLFQRLSNCRYDFQKRMTKTFSRWCPEGSAVSNFLVYLKTDQTFPNFVLKSVIGFVGGIVMTYLCFMFFVFQLAISLMHATIMSSIIGVLLTLGLAFSYRVRCLVFLLIPQCFSRVGRYTLTCYALVLILTGPATNTMKNSEVLSESMACSQEQLKHTVRQINETSEKPLNSMKDTIKIMIDRVRSVAGTLTRILLKINRMALTIVSVMQSSFAWLNSVVATCNRKFGTPYERCIEAVEKGVEDCQTKLGYFHWLCNKERFEKMTCRSVESERVMCPFVEGRPTLMATVKKHVQTFTERVKTMLYVSVQVHQSYSYSSNASHSASQVAAGIVTEIRSRADPLLTWLSWSSCVTSLSLLLIIFRAKYYQNMFETRSRFDNRYITKELRELDLKRMREGRETVLPLNRRERAKYVTDISLPKVPKTLAALPRCTAKEILCMRNASERWSKPLSLRRRLNSWVMLTTSFRLVAPEKLYLTRSVVFMTITTFKLLIHIVADYSLFWVLTTIHYHGRFQSSIPPGPPNAGLQVEGNGTVAGIIRSIVNALGAPLLLPAPAPVSCLPDPYPPDFQRYAQIGMLILMLWFFSMFEPYGLRLRHVIMGLYRPERSKARAVWLYNHIIRTRSGFLKFARRKLHKDYKYFSEEKLTLRQWTASHAPLCWFPWLFRRNRECLLCNPNELDDPDTQFTRCKSPDCPGIYCECCFNDIGQLCTICLSPADYGDLSDVSLEKGSSDESCNSDHDSDDDAASRHRRFGNNPRDFPPENHHSFPNSSKTSNFFSNKQKDRPEEELPLLHKIKKSTSNGNQQSYNNQQRRTKQESNKPASCKKALQMICNNQGCEVGSNRIEALDEDSEEGCETGKKDTPRNKSIVMLLQKCSAKMLSTFYKKRRSRLLVPKTNRSVYIMKKFHKRLEKVINGNYNQRKHKRIRSYETLKRFAQKGIIMQNYKNPKTATSFENKLDKTRDETVTGQDLKTEEVNLIKLQAYSSNNTVNTCNLNLLKRKTKHLGSFTKMFKLFHNRNTVESNTTNNHEYRKKSTKETKKMPKNAKDVSMLLNKKSQREGYENKNQLQETFKDKHKDQASFQDFADVHGGISHTAPSQTSIYSEISTTRKSGNHDNEDGQNNEIRARKPKDRTMFKKTCSLILKKTSTVSDSTSTTGSKCTLEMKQRGSCTCANQHIIALRRLQRNFNKKCDIERHYNDDNVQNIKVRAKRAEEPGILYGESTKSSSLSEQPNTNGTTSTYYMNYNSVEFVNERKVKGESYKKKEVDIADEFTETSLGTLHTVSTLTDDWWSPVLDERKNGCHETKSYKPIKVQFAAQRLVSFKSSPSIIDLENPQRAALDHLWTSTPRIANDKRWKHM